MARKKGITDIKLPPLFIPKPDLQDTKAEAPPPKPKGRRYPWKEWFATRRFTLIKGRDYPPDVKTHSMADMVRQAAVRLGKSVKTLMHDDELGIDVTVVGDALVRRMRRKT